MAKRYSPKLKFQIVLEALKGEQSVAQIAKAYGVHPNSIHKWKQEFLENGPEVVNQRMQYHNVERLHSSIGYRSPLDFIQQVTVMSTPEVHI